MFKLEKAFPQPQPANQETKIQSTRSYDVSPAILELMENKVIFETAITPDTKVCLIGDGQGMDTRSFLDMGVKPQNILSINYEEQEIEQANQTLLKDTGVQMQQGDATNLDALKSIGLDESTQEIVTLMHVLEVPNIKGDVEKSLIHNIALLLKPGGELLVSQYKHKFTKDERSLQEKIGIEEITAESLRKQFGENWKEQFRQEYGFDWEEGMRYGEISNIRTKEELTALFEKDFDIKLEETENEFILKMKKKLLSS